jgi:hypothetical protein
MQKEFYPEIILEGEFFSPHILVQKFSVYVEKATERGDYNRRLNKFESHGYCILRPEHNIDGTEAAIPYLLDQFEKIYTDGLEKNGIEEATFYLMISSLQYRTSIPCAYLQKISKYFKNFNISMVSVT